MAFELNINTDSIDARTLLTECLCDNKSIHVVKIRWDDDLDDDNPYRFYEAKIKKFEAIHRSRHFLEYNDLYNTRDCIVAFVRVDIEIPMLDVETCIYIRAYVAQSDINPSECVNICSRPSIKRVKANQILSSNCKLEITDLLGVPTIKSYSRGDCEFIHTNINKVWFNKTKLFRKAFLNIEDVPESKREHLIHGDYDYSMCVMVAARLPDIFIKSATKY
jgi:hypothetical protein